MHETFKPLAWAVARTIGLRQPWVDKFRYFDFKGKLLIASYLQLPKEGGVHDCGGLAFDLDFSDGIQREIYWGTYERHEKAFLERYVRQGWVCVDIGANVGFYTVNLASVVGASGKVHAIEADAANFQRLRRNVELNSLENVELHNLAVSSRDGPIDFFEGPGENSGWGRVEPFEGASRVSKVEGRCFDSFLSEFDISVVDFLKIDIEGHELQFLEGAKKAFADGRIKKMFIEYCGYGLEPKGITLIDYVNAIEAYGLTPVSMHLDKVADARNGQYVPRGEVFNLLFEAHD